MSKRKRIKILPLVEYLRACFKHDRKNGVLIWKKRPLEHFQTLRAWATWNSRYAGTIAGRITIHGYRVISIGNQLYRAPRIIYKMMTGEEPPETVDHKHGDRANDTWRNLRTANQTQQNWNSKLRKDNTSGYRGVCFEYGKWHVKIWVYGVPFNLGAYDTPEEASIVYQRAARRLHGEFYRS